MSGPAEPSLPDLVDRQPRCAWAETLLIFAVFALVGAWPVPDVNEPYYLGKAIHFWNASWAQGDFFLDTADTHKVFYFVFGWLSLWLSPSALAWTGRLATWALLAWAWQRLSFAVVPRRWMSVLTAVLFITAQESCQMAGEWLIGGVEAKGFAYVLVLFGLEAMLRDRWNRAWLLFGGATFFHVLVGGWSALAAGLTWLALGKTRPPLRAFWPGLLGALLLAMPGFLPSFMLTWGVDPQTIHRAEAIYVFERLNHHLDPTQFRTTFVLHFLCLLAFWLVVRRFAPRGERERRLHGFVGATLAIVAVGAAISMLKFSYPVAAAALLRFYWFRVADVMLPMGVAIGVGALILRDLANRRALGALWLALALLVSAANLGWYANCRLSPGPPRTDKWVNHSDWRDICRWIATSGTIPARATFLTPRPSQTFKWYAGRAEVVNWKEIPQDPDSIVEWRERLEDVFGPRNDERDLRWREPLAMQGAARLRELGVKYGAEYVLTEAEPRVDALPRLYANSSYAVYRLNEGGSSDSRRQGPAKE